MRMSNCGLAGSSAKIGELSTLRYYWEGLVGEPLLNPPAEPMPATTPPATTLVPRTAPKTGGQGPTPATPPAVPGNAEIAAAAASVHGTVDFWPALKVTGGAEGLVGLETSTIPS